eukprot:COSAG02_NODE_2853_length_7891_cov_7.789913_4_plen_103_part_00
MQVHTACAMSHIKVWEKFVAMGVSAREAGEATSINGDDGEDALVLILEDDVRFHKQWQSMLVDIIAALRSKQLGGVEHWSGLLYLDAMDTTGWDLSKKGLVV